MAMLVPLAMMLLNKRDEELKKGNTAVKTPGTPKVAQPSSTQHQMLGAAASKLGAPSQAPPTTSPLAPHPEADGLVRQDPYTLGAGASGPSMQSQPTAVFGQTTAPGPAMQTWGNEGADRPDLDYYGGIYHRSPWEDDSG